MESIKKTLGLLWIALALLSAYFSIVQFGIPKLGTGRQEDLVFGLITLFILTPIISVGLGIFGYYALRGEYGKDKM